MYELDEMVGVVEGWFRAGKASDQQQFLNTPKEKLVIYHSTLGRAIRNEFKLWETEWKPEIVNGVDNSPNHPDNLSFRVIEQVWVKLKVRSNVH